MRSPVFTIVRSELARRRIYMLWWNLGIVALVALTVLAYGGIKEQSAQLNKAFGDLSSSISGFVGTNDMFSPVGYLNSQLYYVTLPILFIILGVTLAGSLVSKEESHRTLELLLARPISRTSLLTAKALTGVAVITIIGAVTALATIFCSAAVDIGVSAPRIILATFIMVLFAGAFGAIAFGLYAASRFTRRSAAAVVILFSLGSYIIASLGGMIHSLSGAAKLFPYHYYNPGDILNGRVDKWLLVYLAALYLISSVIAVVGFRRRDIG